MVTKSLPFAPMFAPLPESDPLSGMLFQYLHGTHVRVFGTALRSSGSTVSPDRLSGIASVSTSYHSYEVNRSDGSPRSTVFRPSLSVSFGCHTTTERNSTEYPRGERLEALQRDYPRGVMSGSTFVPEPLTVSGKVYPSVSLSVEWYGLGDNYSSRYADAQRTFCGLEGAWIVNHGYTELTDSARRIVEALAVVMADTYSDADYFSALTRGARSSAELHADRLERAQRRADALAEAGEIGSVALPFPDRSLSRFDALMTEAERNRERHSG